MSARSAPIVRSIDDVLRPELPVARLGAVRVLVGLYATIYLAVRTPELLALAKHGAQHFDPVGPARLLSAPLSAAALTAVVLASLPAAVAFLLGFRFRVSGPIFAALLTFVLAYRNSFGMVFHTENLLVLHVIGLSLTDAADAFSLDARRDPERAASSSRNHGFGLQLLTAMTATAYVLAGVAKLRISGLQWASGDILRNQIAHDNLRKALLGDWYSPIGGWAIRYAWLFRPFAVLTLVFELAAPFALLGGRVGRAWALSVWSFHVGVLALMWIAFPYQLSFVAYAPLFASERLVGWALRRGKSPGSPGREEAKQNVSAEGAVRGSDP